MKNMIPTKNYFFAAVAMTLLLNTASAWSQTAVMPYAKDYKVGTIWDWLQFDTRTKVEVGKSSRSVVEDEGKVRFFDGKNKYFTLHGDKSEKPFRSWPLEVGKAWEFEKGTLKMDAKVVAYESVEVPAGKFMALKIVYKGYFTNNFGSHPITETFWYAPEIAADIKYVVEERDHSKYETRELVRYQIGTP